MRTTSEDERARTLEVMQSLYETAGGQTQALFRRASDQFNDFVREMKEAASTIQRELEGTREELRRGIFELPQDTAESAAQMRRVVVDQIEALAELNRIVAKHGRTLDTVEPARASVREEAMLAVAGATGQRPPLRSDAAIGSRAAPAARRPEGRPEIRPASGGGDGSWVNDVFMPNGHAGERVGAKPQPPRGQAMSPLDTISLDIARLVDHEASVALWEQRDRGDRVIAGMDLYTPTGEKTFDDIRRRYRADRDFKHTVDRYIVEFERLLDEVSREGRPGVSLSYLTSETGKVYTMLAHASGRLE